MVIVVVVVPVSIKNVVVAVVVLVPVGEVVVGADLTVQHHRHETRYGGESSVSVDACLRVVVNPVSVHVWYGWCCCCCL